ncbi:hypothetical protein IG631_23052 [Alternaria alternata]|nr:hypothetical protein IG631_23052 [Alternaria alternata]
MQGNRSCVIGLREGRRSQAQHAPGGVSGPRLTVQIPGYAPKMNNTVKTNNIDEKTWERHRPSIESLYWGKSLSAIEAHMRERYAFVARYLRQLATDP